MLEETHVIEIEPPLQIVYIGNGCEGYSPSMFLPAKNEMAIHAQVESRKEYFLQFNYVYTPDRYIGLWWQFRTRLMTDEDAKAFITQVAPLGTMDYSLLQKRPPIIDTNYGFSLPVPPVTLGIGIVVIILLIAGVALGCYVYRMRKTFSLATGTIKKSNWQNLFLAVAACFPGCTSAPDPLCLHVPYDDKGLSRTCQKPMQQKYIQYRWQKSWGMSSRTLK